MRGYFGLDGYLPVYDGAGFERQFRGPWSVFLPIYCAVIGRPFFAQRINATGRPQAHPLRELVAAFRVTAYGEAPDRTDEYVRLFTSTIALSVLELLRCIVDEFGAAYLRPPTPDELERILERNEQRRWLGWMGSLVCNHWEWANSPKAFAGMYQNRQGKRSVVGGPVSDEDPWIWHLFVGCPGSQKGLNSMHASPLYFPVTGGERPPRTFSYRASGTTRTLSYYLVYGMYPPFAFFDSPFPDPTTEAKTTFNRLQASLRTAVKRLCAVLTARFLIASQPARHVNVESMVTVAKAVAILSNMVTEKRRDGYVARTRMASAAQAAPGGSGGGDAVVGGAEGVANGAAETPAAAGGAASGAAGDAIGMGGSSGMGSILNGGSPAASVGAAGGGAAVCGNVVTGLIPDGGGPAAGVGAAGGGAAGGEGGGTRPTGDGCSHAAGGGAARGSPQSNANSLGGSYGPPTGMAVPVIAPAGALSAGSSGHAMKAWGRRGTRGSTSV